MTMAIMLNTNPFVDLDDYAVMEAMFGREKLAVWTDPTTGRISSQATYFTRHGRLIHPEAPAPWVSAVAVLEFHEPDSEQFYDLVVARVGEVPNDFDPRWFERWESASQELRRERPDLNPDRKVLRMRVFENPEAERPLPRTILAGTYDLRYGAWPDGRYGLIRVRTRTPNSTN
jgi:hypothetical protein